MAPETLDRLKLDLHNALFGELKGYINVPDPYAVLMTRLMDFAAKVRKEHGDEAALCFFAYVAYDVAESTLENVLEVAKDLGMIES